MSDATAVPSFYVGPVPVFGRAILSPMDGYSDLPFRGLCRRLGSAMAYTEFVSCIHVLAGSGDALRANPNLARRITYAEWERPVVFQIFDDDPRRMLEAALRLRDLGPDIIDVNMGCSARAIAARGAGAGLLQTPHRIAEIFALLTRHLDIPVTGKMRLGWDDDSRHYIQTARIIADNGAALLAVHGRTKAQAYGGVADWDAIAEIKAALRIPVIGNGDVKTPDDIGRMREHTGCDGVMIARAAIGNPWIFAGLDRAEVSREQTRATMLEHLDAMLDFYGPDEGLVLFRKHAKQYISPYPLTQDLRTRLLTARTAADFCALLDDILSPAAVPA